MESLPHQLLYSGRKSPHFLACALRATTHRTPRGGLLPLLISAKVGVRRMPASLASGRAHVSAVPPSPLRFLLSLSPSVFTLAWRLHVSSLSGRSSQTDRLGHARAPLRGMPARYPTAGPSCSHKGPQTASPPTLYDRPQPASLAGVQDDCSFTSWQHFQSASS